MSSEPAKVLPGDSREVLPPPVSRNRSATTKVHKKPPPIPPAARARSKSAAGRKTPPPFLPGIRSRSGTASGKKTPPPLPVVGRKSPPPFSKKSAASAAATRQQHPFAPAPSSTETPTSALQTNGALANEAKSSVASRAHVTTKRSFPLGIKPEAQAASEASQGKRGPPGHKKRIKPGKLGKKAGFMLALDNIFAGGGGVGGGMPMWKKKLQAKNKGEEDVTTEITEVKIQQEPQADPLAASKPARRKPQMRGKRKRGKRKKFDAKKTAFATQKVREYKKTDYSANALKLTEAQRIQVFTLVKEGHMSPDEAMDAVLAHDKKVSAHITEQHAKIGSNKVTKFDAKKQIKATDLAALTEEQRVNVIMLVKDGTVTMEEAMRRVTNQVRSRKGLRTDDKPADAATCCVII